MANDILIEASQFIRIMDLFHGVRVYDFVSLFERIDPCGSARVTGSLVPYELFRVLGPLSVFPDGADVGIHGGVFRRRIPLLVPIARIVQRKASERVAVHLVVSDVYHAYLDRIAGVDVSGVNDLIRGSFGRFGLLDKFPVFIGVNEYRKSIIKLVLTVFFLSFIFNRLEVSEQPYYNYVYK